MFLFVCYFFTGLHGCSVLYFQAEPNFSWIFIFHISNRSVLKAANSSWVLPLWRKGSLVCILTYFRLCLVNGKNRSLLRTLLFYFIFSFHLGHVPHRLVGPGPWVNPIQYFYCSCCAPVGGGMVQPPAVVDGGSQVTNGLFAFSDTVSLKSHVSLNSSKC